MFLPYILDLRCGILVRSLSCRSTVHAQIYLSLEKLVEALSCKLWGPHGLNLYFIGDTWAGIYYQVNNFSSILIRDYQHKSNDLWSGNFHTFDNYKRWTLCIWAHVEEFPQNAWHGHYEWLRAKEYLHCTYYLIHALWLEHGHNPHVLYFISPNRQNMWKLPLPQTM